jgi:hypothetical protein
MGGEKWQQKRQSSRFPSPTSVNLAWCVAEDENQTCLIDMEFRAPGVMFMLGYKPEWDGVTEVLAGESDISLVIRQASCRRKCESSSLQRACLTLYEGSSLHARYLPQDYQERPR